MRFIKKLTMNKKLILFGSLAVSAIAAITAANLSTPESVYSARVIKNEGNASIEGAFEIYHMLRGDFTKEDWLRAKYESANMAQDRTEFNWLDQGPDNVGGRTRAILVDRADINHVYAGSVSGGLFESFSRASEWQRVEEFETNLGISSMCQTVDGTLYVATGHSSDQTSGSQTSGYNGDGVWKRETNGTFTQIPGTGAIAYTTFNEVVCDTLNNKIWIASNVGLHTYDATNGFVEVSNGLTSGVCSALSISPDGQLIVCCMSSGKTNVSTDGGVSFTDVSTVGGLTVNEINAGATRTEYAISHEKGSTGKYYVYAVLGGSQHLQSVWRSTDDGMNWTMIAPAGNGNPGTFSPFSHSPTSGQASYDMIISVQRGNPEKVFLGGIDNYSWCTTCNWTKISQWFYDPTSPLYVHADNHEMVWDKEGRLYIGNDGGISFSDDGGNTFVHANRGYNVTQFYSVGFSAHGDVIGGAQDNGTQANYHDNATYRSHDEVGGGDGFSSAISFINRNVLFSSIYGGGVYRSSDRGGNSTEFIPEEWGGGASEGECEAGASEGGCGSFYTSFKMWENPNDLNSTDTINYIPQQAYAANDVVLVPSLTSTKFISYVTPDDIVFDDTLVFNPALTALDTLITSTAPSTEYNLAIVEHYLVFGAAPITPGDSIYITALDTTVMVADTSMFNHYYGTNVLRPGKVYDMENDAEVYDIAWDTIKVQDPYQSWFAIGFGGSQAWSATNPHGIWMTRNALRLSADGNEWFKVCGNGIASQVSVMEFSRDGNTLWIGTWGGQLYRLSGFGQVYSPKKEDGDGYFADTMIDWELGHSATTLILAESFGAPVTGIGVEGDNDHVVVTLGLFGGSDKVRRTLNATGADPSFTNIGAGLPAMPMYSVVIDRDNPMTIIVGGEFGTYYTETGGGGPGEWTNCSGAFGNVPVFDMGQNWRTFNEGAIKSGQIYIGTHGRGIWSSDAYLSTPETQDNLAPNKFTPNINVYPNPMTEQGNLAFDLTENSDVYIQIFNLNGQLVKEISEANMAAGKNNVTFETSELTKGTYIVRLTAGTMVESTKFIKH